MSSKALWKPKLHDVKSSFLNNFCNILEKKKYLKNDQDFFKLWQWSINNPEIFWSEFWDFCKIKGLKGKKTIDWNKLFYKTRFFFRL